MPELSLKERLLGRMEIVTESGCWLWAGSVTRLGYGKINVNRRTTLTHRASYAEFKGEIPKGMCVCHTCDVRSCINPSHLFLGTHKDNMADMTAKGRKKGRKQEYRNGEGNPNSKITESQALEIRASKEAQKILSKKYNVSTGTISSIKTGKRWSHL